MKYRLEEAQGKVVDVSTLGAQRLSMHNEFRYHSRKLQNIADMISPNSYREIFVSHEDRGGRDRSTQILNPVGREAREIFISGMLMLTANPSERWFTMEMSRDRGMLGGVRRSFATKEVGELDQYLEDTTTWALDVLRRSNFYQTYKTCLGDLATFSSMAALIEESDTRVFRLRHLTMGAYMVETDFDGFPIALMVEHQLDARQIRKRFGLIDADGRPDYSHLPTYVNNNWKTNKARYSILQYIYENDRYRQGGEGLDGEKYVGVYYIYGTAGAGLGQGNNTDGVWNSTDGNEKVGKNHRGLLEVSGYDYCPILFAPWAVAQNDTYGHDGPGEKALDMLRALQHAERRGDQGMDQNIWPTTVGHSGLKIKEASLSEMRPGRIHLTDDLQAAQLGLQPLARHPFRVDQIEGRIIRKEQKIRDLFFNNLILKISDLNKSNTTATEINALLDEKLVLVPSYSTIEAFFFDRVLSALMTIGKRRELFPEPPHGEVNSTIVYRSKLADAQSLGGLGDLDRMLEMVQRYQPLLPNLPRKFKTEEVANTIAQSLGVPTSVVIDNETYFETMAAEAEEQAEQEAAMQEQMDAQTNKLDSETKQADGTSMLDAKMAEALGGAGGDIVG